jgi:hypothetical protein
MIILNMVKTVKYTAHIQFNSVKLNSIKLLFIYVLNSTKAKTDSNTAHVQNHNNIAYVKFS